MNPLIGQLASLMSIPDGEFFFSSLAERLAHILEVDFVLVGELTGSGKRGFQTLGLHSEQRLLPNLCCDVSIEENQQWLELPPEMLPDDNSQNLWKSFCLARTNTSHSVGLPLLDSQSQVIGLVAVANREPLADMEMVSAVLEIVAARLAAKIERTRLERSSEENERRFLTFIAHSPVIVWSTNERGVITSSGGQGLASVGLLPGQLVGESVFDLYRDYSHVIECNRRALSGEKFTTKNNFKDVVLETNWIPIFDDQGNVSGVTGISIDVTERERASQELHKNEGIFGALVQNSSEITARISGNGAILYISPAVNSILGYRPEEAWGRQIFDFVHPEDKKLLTAEFETIVRVGSSTLSPFRVRNVSGSWVWLESVGTNLLDDPHVQAVVINSRDVTMRRLSEIALQESEERFTAFVNNSPALAYVKDEEGRYVYLNRTMERTFKTSPAELIGRTDFHWLPDEIAQQLRENDLQVTSTGQTLQFIEVTPTPDGHLYDWLSFKFPLRSANGNCMIGAVSIDITERQQAKNSLWESQKNLQALFDNALDVILLSNDEGRYLKANPAASDLLGYSQEELLQMSIFDLASPGEGERILNLWQQLMEQGQLSGEFAVLCKDKSMRDVSFRSVSNIVPGLHLTMIHDITERKRNEEALRRSQMLLAEAQQLAHLGSWEWDLKTDRMTGSDEFLHIFGVTSEQFEGNLASVLERIHPEDRQQVQMSYKESAHTGQAFKSYYRVLHPDGQPRLVYSRGAVSLNEEGIPVRIFGTVQDITERRQIEDALRESESRFRCLTQANIIGIIISDLQGRILEANPVFLDLVGYSSQELESGDVRWDSMTPPQHRRQMDRALAQLRESQAALPWEQALICKGGALVPVLMGAALLEGSQDHLIAFILDHRAQKAAESSLREATQQLGQSHQEMRALAAHLESIQEATRTRIAREIHDELGQALSGLKMDLSWIIRRLPLDATPGASELQNHISGMSHLIDNTIQSVRRICAELRPRILDDLGLEAAVEWQVQEFQKRTGTRCRVVSSLKGVGLEREISTTVFRILQEALTNVARHAAPTRVTITLKIVQKQLVMQVKDNGRGFDPLFVANKRTLGLLGMHERALILRGNVRVNSVESKGTTVELCIPLE